MGNNSNLIGYIPEFRNKRILIIGDAIIDNFIHGTTNKISPDAPVPLVDVTNEYFYIGALGRVIGYTLKMGGAVDVISCIGNDFEGEFIIKKMEDLNLDHHGILKLDTFTPKISRIISRDQQLLRIEKRYSLTQEEIKQLNQFVLDYMDESLKKADAVAILDYNLGFLNPLLISQIVAKIKEHQIPLVVRPEAGKYSYYTGADILYMNQNVASSATGIQPLNETCMRIMGLKLLNEIRSSVVFIPWVEGDSYYYENNNFHKVASLMKYRAISYWGVGSASMSALALMCAIRAPKIDAIHLAHYAGSLAAFKKNSEYFTLEELRGLIETDEIPSL